MGRIVKWLLLGIAGILVLLIMFAVAVVLLVNPNEYRGDIERVVAAQTGRRLAIQGDLNLTFFPWIGIKAGRMQLADAPGFGKEPFFQANQIQLALKVLPLLQGKLVLDTITLEHPQIHLIRNIHGIGNWETLIKPGPRQVETPSPLLPAAFTAGSDPQTPAQLPPLLREASLAGLRIRDGLISWDDQQTDRHVVITPCNATLDNIRLGAPITVQADCRGRIKGGPDFSTGLTGTVLADRNLQQISARDLDLTLDASGGDIPGGKQQLRIRAQALADLAKAAYRITDLRLDAAGVEAQGQISAQRQANGLLVATGALQIPEFNPRQTLQRLGMDKLATRDASVLKRASAQTKLAYRGGALALEPLTLQLDDSTLNGHVRIRNSTGPATEFDLALDHIDADRYLPPPRKGKQVAATPAGAAAAGADQLPVSTLRTLDLDGHIHIGKLKVSGANISNADVTIRAKNGHLRVHPLTADLYGGRYQGDMRLDATGKAPRIDLDEHLSGVQAEPLLSDTASFQKLLGTADVSLQAKTQGQEKDQWLRSLTGQAHFTFRNGAIKGIDIARAIRTAQAQIKGEPPPASEGPPKTDFTELSGTMNLDGGMVHNRDLSAKSPLLRVQGQGDADLLKQTLDYRLTVNIVGTLKGQGGKDLEQLRGVPIPLRFTGSFSKPHLSVDLASLFKQRLEQKQQKLEQKGQKKLQEQLQKQLNRLLDH